MNNIHFLLQGFTAAALALLAAGCGPKQTYFVVEPSSLNHTFVTYAANTNHMVIMEFLGTGYSVMRKGDTPGALNPYALQPHATREIRREFTPEMVNAIFQSLVREGVYDKEPKDKRPFEPPYVSMRGSIQNKRFERVSRTPEFLLMASWMADLFEKPEQHGLQLRRSE